MAICLLINGFLSGLEMAFVAVGRPRLRELARTGNRDAQKILALRDNPERTLSVLQVGITLVGVLAAAVGGAGAEEAFSPILESRFALSENTAEIISILFIVLPYTYLSVVIGELVPKSLALRNPLSIILRGARWLILFDRAVSPVVSVLEWSTKRILSLFQKRTGHDVGTTPQEALILEVEGLSQDHKQYVMNLLAVRRKSVNDILLPWPQVVAVDLSQSVSEVADVIYSSGHTRLPVTSVGTVVGILHTKEFMALRSAGAEEWESIVRPIVQVQESDLLISALKVMQEKRSHLSIVFLGKTHTGIVTMEDIFEEIIGEIYDEDDDGRLKRILSARKDRLREWVKQGDAVQNRSEGPPSQPVVVSGVKKSVH